MSVMADAMADACTKPGQFPYCCQGNFFCDVSPYAWAGIGLGLTLSMSIVGAAWGIWTCGTSILGAGVKHPRVRGKHIISIVFCEAVAIYGVIMAMLMMQLVKTDNKLPSGTPSPTDYTAGYLIFAAGIIGGVSNLASGISVGVCGSAAVLGDAQNGTLFVKLIVVEIFATALGLFGVISGLLMTAGEGFARDVAVVGLLSGETLKGMMPS